MQVHCAFRVLECPHAGQPLFSTEYKRSNRTRMSKILRCFPHCCPSHRPRSYCGSALHVQVTLVGDDNANSDAAPSATDDDQLPLFTLDVLSPAQALSDFVVYGRFEVHDPDDPLKTDLALGARVAATDITDNRDPDVIWVPGPVARSPSAQDVAETGPSRLFVLNEGDGESHHWEYDWRSGTSQRKRACQHQFRAYVFLPDAADAGVWQVVGVASSTPFTLSSYRKQDDEDYDMGVPSDMSLIQELSAVVAAGGVLPLPPADTAAPPPPPLASDPVNEILLLRQNQQVVGATTKLAVIFNLLAVIDVSWIPGDVLTDHVVSILRSNPTTPGTSLVYYATLDQSLHQYATRCVMPLLTALRAVSPRARSDAWLSKWSGLLKLCVDLFCQLVKNGQLSELQALVRHAAQIRPASDAHVMTAFVELIKTLARQAEATVAQLNHHASLDLMVDDIVTCVFDEDPDFDWVPRFTRDEALRLLRNTTLLGLHPYREQLRLCAALPDPPFHSLPSEVSRLFTGLWTCVSVDPSASLTLPPPPLDFGVSALAAIQLLSAAHKLELVLDGDAAALRVRSAWSCFAELWSVHALDGQLHASSVLPNGLGPAFWQQLGAGSVVGDYRGALRQADDGAIVLDIDAFVYSIDQPSYCLQLTLVPASGAGEPVYQLVVHAHVYRSRVVSDLTTDALALLTPVQRSNLVTFAPEHLVVAATLVYEQTPAR